MKKEINILLSIYLITLFCFSVFFLNEKHIVGNDSTISEWLINYEGGFTKRGLIGQIAIYFAYFLKTNLRDSILIMQILIVLTYFILLFNFFKNLKIDRLMMLSIFTPIFILYPVAEIEVLARKEVFIFCIFLLTIKIKNNFYINVNKFLILPIAVLIWEPIVFFFPFFIAWDLINLKLFKFKKIFLKLFPTYLPSLFIAFYIMISPISLDNHNTMSEFLKNEFDEVCYMSCALLKSKQSLYQHLEAQFGRYSFEVLLRYFLVILVGFGPLFLLLKNSCLKDKKIFFFKNFKSLLFPYLLLISPIIPLAALAYDWYRWVNVSYFFSVILYYQLFKNDLIEINNLNLNKFTNILKNKKVFIIIFIIYCFSWNPKTVMTGDVASFPGYRIPYKVFKIVNLKYF